MDPLRELGKLLLVFGVVLVLVGVLLTLGASRSFGSLGRIGRLPGDILIRRENFTFYFPIVTSLLLSVILTLLFWLLGRR
jgi:hypothetical protein